MQEDDEVPRPRRRLEPLPLATLGVDELRAYIAELAAEIARVEADIARKSGHRQAADAFFKATPGFRPKPAGDSSPDPDC